MLRTILLPTFLLLMLVGGPSLTYATADFSGASFYTLEAGKQAVNDMYIASTAVSLSGDAKQDVVLFGRDSFQLSGTVGADVLGFSKDALLGGTVHDDVRLVAWDSVFTGTIKGDVVVLGSNVVFTPTSVVEGDVFVYGQSARLDGVVQGKTHVGSAIAVLTGRFTGDVAVWSSDLRVASSSVLQGNFSYSTPNIMIEEGATITGTVEQKKGIVSHRESGFWERLISLPFLMMFFIAFFLFFAFRTLAVESAHDVLGSFWRSLLVGGVSAILLLGLGVALLSSLVGALGGVLLLSFLGMIVMCAVALAPIALGMFLMKILSRGTEYVLSWKAVVVGIMVMRLLGFVPLLGDALILALVFASIGSLVQHVYDRLRFETGKDDVEEDNVEENVEEK